MKQLLLIAIIAIQCNFAQQNKPDYLIYDWDSLIEVYVHDTYSEAISYWMESDEIVPFREHLEVTKLNDILDELGLEKKFVLPYKKMSSVSAEDLIGKNFKLNVWDDDVFFNFLSNKEYLSRFYWDDELDEAFRLDFKTITIANIDFILLRDEYLPEDSLGFICKVNNKFLILYDDEVVRSTGKDRTPDFNLKTLEAYMDF